MSVTVCSPDAAAVSCERLSAIAIRNLVLLEAASTPRKFLVVVQRPSACDTPSIPFSRSARPTVGDAMKFITLADELAAETSFLMSVSTLPSSLALTAEL